ncbi:MAG: hypothetical protein LBN43_02480 [Oscillospiraceae bacterium]|jgi:putative aldouronate transport system substrate-binding protein|nr:hypothetical protein [Oscillospiraceae bacterium]
MKRKITLILAIAMVVSLFAACAPTSGTDSTAPPSTAPTQAAATPGSDTSGGDTPDSSGATLSYTELPHASDTLAVNSDGSLKYEIGSNGYPLESYEYELPLSTSDDTFTLSKIIFDMSIIPESGLDTMSFQTFMRETTGVNIHYRPTAFVDLSTQFSIDLAADQLDDIILDGVTYYGLMSPLKSFVDDKYAVNLAEYRAYMPDYMWQIPRQNYDVELEQQIWYDNETIIAFYCFTENPAPNMGWCVRADWLDRLGLKVSDVVTYDQIHDMLKRFQTEIGIANPMYLAATLEGTNGTFFGGMNTGLVVGPTAMPYIRVENSKVVYTATEEIDHQAMTLLATWFEENLITKNWNSTDTAAIEADLYKDGVGYYVMAPSMIHTFNEQAIDPNTRWEALPLNKLAPDTKFQYARGTRSWALAFSNWSINAKASNIPLLVSYADWYYSTEGGFTSSYGQEGVAWIPDENGNPKMTDEARYDPTGLFMIMFAGDPFSDVGLQDQLRTFRYPGGEEYVNMLKSWIVPDYPFFGGMDWPSTNAKGTDEQQAEVSNLSADVAMYIGENFVQFVDGTRPMSEWNTYIAGLDAVGFPRIKQIMQEVYDKFIVENPEYAQR